MKQYIDLENEAVSVLKEASVNNYIQASAQNSDNYNRVWARDCAVTGISILSNNLKEFYPALKSSILLLQKQSLNNGQIPSNVMIDTEGKASAVSFGGPVGRTDTSFWWVIVTLLYLKKQPDDQLSSVAYNQCKSIFKLAENWEFNGKGLMYLPMGSNWADEYVTTGYVLYDQVLRHWSLLLAGRFFTEEKWHDDALDIKTKIKQHFLLEGDLSGSLYTSKQQAELADFDLSKNFIASFTPGGRVEKFDAWSIGLLLLLGIPSQLTTTMLEKNLMNIYYQVKGIGLPAFWPAIKEGDKDYDALTNNHSFSFKNQPGKFHNGGIWPVVNGFLVAGLAMANRTKSAEVLMNTLCFQLQSGLKSHPFNEYFDSYNAKPEGVDKLCFSAAGYLIAKAAVENAGDLQSYLSLSDKHNADVGMAFKALSTKIIDKINLYLNKTTVISISGESGSGKTTLSDKMADELRDMGFQVMIIHQDDYFKLPPKRNHLARLANFDNIGPQEVRLDLLEDHLDKIKQKTVPVIQTPVMNWETDAEETVTHQIQNVNLVLVEGTYTSMLSNIDCRIFIETTYKNTRVRRIIRNRETVTDFIEKVLEKESSIIGNLRKSANIIVNNELQIVKDINPPYEN